MGLFSFLNKNKQESAGEDSGYFSRDEDSATTRARSKRASSANEPAPGRGKKSRAADDPVLPEKKRARRRLVGAIALALAVAVGLPMVLDSEPKPLASDIAIQIPSRDKAPPLPLPAAPAAVLAADSLDKREEIVEAPKADAAAVKAVALTPKPEPKAAVQKPEPKAEPKHEPKVAVVKAEPKAEPKPEPKPEPKLVAKVEPKPAAKPSKAEEKPADKPPQDTARALAILEGKPADKEKAEPAGQKFVVQVAALGSAEKVAELQEKLREAGISSVTHKVSTPSGERIQVRVGPFSHDDADKMRARVDRLGLPGSQIRPAGK